MLTASAEYRGHWAESSECMLRVTFDWADGTTTVMTGDDLMMGGVEVTKASTPSGSFDVGGVVVGTARVTLNNLDGRLDDLTFDGAEVAVEVGVELADGGTEWVLVGTYDAVQPESYGATVAVELQDPLGRLDRDFSDVVVGYPCSLAELLSETCTACGVTMASGSFPNSSVRVPAAPSVDCSCADVVGWIGRAAGCFAICDPRGRLAMRWYDGESDPIAVTAISSLTVTLDDVLVTGVRVQASEGTNASGERVDGEASTYGSEGYVLDLGQNPLVAYGGASACASRVGERVVGMHFRPFSASAVGNPLWEPGDPVTVTDSRGVTHGAWLTSFTWRAGAYEQLACDAKPPVRNAGRGRTSDVARAIMRVNDRVAYERTQRELAVASLQRQIDTAGGTYRTEETLPDGSTIIYVHDKPTVAESTVVWKLTAEALGLSTDGGRTYPYGLDVTGTAILDRIYAIGIDADYIRTGSVRGRQSESSWDLDTGVFEMRKTMEPMDSVDSLVLNGTRSQSVVGTGKAVVLDHYYLVALSADSSVDFSKVYLYANALSAFNRGHEELQMVSEQDGVTRYHALLYANQSASLQYGISFSGALNADVAALAGVTVSDVRLYELPYQGDGIIRLTSVSEDGEDRRVSEVTGASIVMISNDVIAEMLPDRIWLARDGGYFAPAQVRFGSAGYVGRPHGGGVRMADANSESVNGYVGFGADHRFRVTSPAAATLWYYGIGNVEETCNANQYNTMVDAAARGMSPECLSGQINMSGTLASGRIARGSVTFASEFRRQPAVVIVPYHSSDAALDLRVLITQVSKTGFSFAVRNDGTANIRNFALDWIAARRLLSAEDKYFSTTVTI